ncbi:MAG: MobF family relaxase [Bacteroidota bacterium]
MIRIIVSTSAEAAKSYFQDGLSKSDYYLNDQELPAHWHGKAAAMLGLSGPVQAEQLYALADNRHPETGKAITPGGNRPNRRVGYDINFHCPKSVSVLHALGNDNRILDAFQDSVDATMQDMEADMQTRVRVKGQYKDRETGNMVWARFTHQTARPTKEAPPDPHLHAHCYAFNITFDKEENRFKAGQFVTLKKDGMYYQALFHKRLADKLQAMGYTIRKTKSAFEVEEVSKEAIALFSKRTNHIGQVAKEKGITKKSELDKLGAYTRAAKQKGLTMPDLRKHWRSQLKPNPVRKGQGGKGAPTKTPQQCVTHAIHHTFERLSVINERKLKQEALRHGLGSREVTIEALDKQFTEDKRLVRLDEAKDALCTTPEVLAEEQEMVDRAIDGQGSLSPVSRLPRGHWQNKKLNLEQKQAVNRVLMSRDRVTLIQGRAGTGKTTMIKEAIAGFNEHRKRVYTFAPTADASRGTLREEGFKEADTIAKLLTDKDLHKQIKHQVVWIDEAGLMGSRDMLRILRLAEQQDCRLILSGDTKQHRSVARGDAFRVLQDVAGLKATGTKTIYRQQQKEYREVVEALSEGRTGPAFSQLDRMGALREIGTDDIIEELTNSYLETTKWGKSALVISPTIAERDKVNAHIRDSLRKNGRLGWKSRTLTRLQSLQWTEAEKADSRNYTPGLVIQPHTKISKHVGRGQKFEVINVKTGKVLTRDRNGRLWSLPLDKAGRFDVYERSQKELAKRDRIRITRNGSDKNKERLDNGMMLEVIGLTKDGHIRAQTASTSKKAKNLKQYLIPHSHENWDYAYCQTSYAAQGKTVDRVFIHQPAATFPATNQEQVYVSVSRGREAVTIYTDDKDELRQMAQQSSRRMAALEVPLPDYGYERTPEPERRPEIEIEVSVNISPPKPKSHGYDLPL